MSVNNYYKLLKNYDPKFSTRADSTCGSTQPMDSSETASIIRTDRQTHRQTHTQLTHCFTRTSKWSVIKVTYVGYILHVSSAACYTVCDIKRSSCSYHYEGYKYTYALLCHNSALQNLPCGPKKTDPLVYFDDNFGKYGPILTIFSLLQQKIHDAHKSSYFSHLTFIMLPLYLAKQTPMLVSMRIFLDHATKQISMYSNG